MIPFICSNCFGFHYRFIVAMVDVEWMSYIKMELVHLLSPKYAYG